MFYDVDMRTLDGQIRASLELLDRDIPNYDKVYERIRTTSYSKRHCIFQIEQENREHRNRRNMEAKDKQIEFEQRLREQAEKTLEMVVQSLPRKSSRPKRISHTKKADLG